MSTTAKLALVALVAAAALFGPARARAQIEGLAEWADYVATASMPHWVGQRVPWPHAEPRPAPGLVGQSLAHPWNLHARGDVSGAALAVAARSLDAAAVALEREGWPAPSPDGGEGGTSGFDVYLESTESGLCRLVVERRVLGVYFDAAVTFALVDADLDDDALASCVTRLYAEASLAALDPAEAAPLREGLASWLTWRVTGAFTDAETGVSSGRWWALASALLDGGNGAAVLELVHFARQRTWDGVDLRGAPDLWMALDKRFTLAGQTLEAFVEDLSASAWLSSTRSPSRSPALVALGPQPRAAPLADLRWDALPQHVYSSSEGTTPLESQYFVVDTKDAPVGSLLRVWLSGEFGVKWQLVLTRFAADGRSLGTVSTPARNEPRAYFPLELSEPTSFVVGIVTNLSSRLPDYDRPDENVRAFKVIVDKHQP